MVQRVLICLLLLAAASALPVTTFLQGQAGRTKAEPAGGGKADDDAAEGPKEAPPPVPLKRGKVGGEPAPAPSAVVKRKKLSHPALPATEILTPELHVRLANLHVEGEIQKVRLAAVKAGQDPDLAAAQFVKDEVVNWRFLSWYALSSLPDERVETWKRVARWWIHQLSTGPDVVLPLEVPGGEGYLWLIDLRDYRWNAAAFRAVAQREPFFVEPAVDTLQAARLRGYVGEKQVASKVNAEFYPVVAMLRADWLVRDTMESDRSTSYYDLLYARRRFGDPTETRESYTATEEYTEMVPRVTRQQVYHPQFARYVWTDVTSYEEVKKTRSVTKYRTVKGGGFIDFPRDEDDWNDFWGIKDVKKFLAKQNLDVARGAVVAGSRDSPLTGSIVARNNRVTEFIQTPTGVAMKTYDAKKTARNTDFIEDPKGVAVGKIKFDVGELLISLPNGGQAGLLINGQGKRTEVAPATFAHNRVDTRFVDVRTMMGCVTCHAGNGGVVPPRDTFKELLKAGIDLKVKDRDERNRIRAFFLEWEVRVEGWQRPYYRLIERTTRHPLILEDTGLTPATLVKEYLTLRDWYDDPVTPVRAAVELGVPLPTLKLVAAKSPKGRANSLARGLSVPRDAFDDDVYAELVLLYAAYRKAALIPDG